MALKGNLRDFSVTQLLNLVHIARKTGTLVVENPSRPAVRLAFREGKLVFLQFGSEIPTLVKVLFKAQKITESQARALQARAGTVSDRDLARLLVNAGYITQQDILLSYRQQVSELISNLFAWEDGQFRFAANEVPTEQLILVPIELESLILEGARRMKEQEQLQRELPDLERVLRFTERPDARLRNVNLSVDEWKVVSFITPKNTIRQIARANNMDETKIRRIVYGLMQAGLVQVLEPAPLPARVPVNPISTNERTEKKSLINRLIARIRSL